MKLINVQSHDILAMMPTLSSSASGQLLKAGSRKYKWASQALYQEAFRAILKPIVAHLAHNMGCTLETPLLLSNGNVISSTRCVRMTIGPIKGDYQDLAKSLNVRGCGTCHADDSHKGLDFNGSPKLRVADVGVLPRSRHRTAEETRHVVQSVLQERKHEDQDGTPAGALRVAAVERMLKAAGLSSPVLSALAEANIDPHWHAVFEDMLHVMDLGLFVKLLSGVVELIKSVYTKSVVASDVIPLLSAQLDLATSVGARMALRDLIRHAERALLDDQAGPTSAEKMVRLNSLIVRCVKQQFPTLSLKVGNRFDLEKTLDGLVNGEVIRTVMRVLRVSLEGTA